MICYIATYYAVNNYGTRLQNYALLTTLKRFGIDTYTLYLDNNDESKIKKIIKNICISFPCVTSKQKIWINEKKKESAFNNFNSNLNFKHLTSEELKKLQFIDSIALAGSDQIWLPNHLSASKIDIPLFFLQFAPKEKRFAYAPSFGVETIPEDMKSLYRDNLSGFNMISVREEAGKKIVKNLIGFEPQVVPDPVFLLSRKQWEEISYCQNEGRKKYILLYFLGRYSDDFFSNIYALAKEKGLSIIRISGNEYNKNDLIVPPDEFVGLMENAQIVFTDSFHACAFAIIMRTNFYVYKRNDVKQFSRIHNLLKKMNLVSHIIDNMNFSEIYNKTSEEIIDCDELIENEAQIGKAYLKRIIDYGKE